MTFHSLLYISETRMFAYVFRRVTWKEVVARNNILNEEFVDISVCFSNRIDESPFAGDRQWKATNNTTIGI